MPNAAGAVAVTMGKNLVDDGWKSGTTLDQALVLFGGQREASLSGILGTLSFRKLDAVMWLGHTPGRRVEWNAIGAHDGRKRDRKQES
jgi:hypothetical protein